MDSISPTGRLRAAGLRVTVLRVALLELFGATPHATVDELLRAARERLGTASAQAVYDALRGLGVASLVRRIEPAGSPARYETRTGDNHHHVVCRACGVTRDVDCAVGERPCLTPAEAHGFDLDEAEVTFWGLCPDCQRRPERLALPLMATVR